MGEAIRFARPSVGHAASQDAGDASSTSTFGRVDGHESGTPESGHVPDLHPLKRFGRLLAGQTHKMQYGQWPPQLLGRIRLKGWEEFMYNGAHASLTVDPSTHNCTDQTQQGSSLHLMLSICCQSWTAQLQAEHLVAGISNLEWLMHVSRCNAKLAREDFMTHILTGLMWAVLVMCNYHELQTCNVASALALLMAGGSVNKTARLLFCGGMAGAVSRTMTAPIDRLKFLSQVHRSSHLTIRQVCSAFCDPLSSSCPLLSVS